MNDLMLYGTDLYNESIIPLLKGQDDKNKIRIVSLIIVTSIWLLYSIFHRSRNNFKKMNDEDTVYDSDDVIDNNDSTKKNHEQHSRSIALAFSDIKLVLQDKKKNDKVLLNGSINGYVETGHMLAILGPSGAGKTSLLHALAGRIKYNKKLTLYGQRYIQNGIPLSNNSLIPSSAFIEQDVLFFPHMTVYETLYFRLQLINTKSISQYHHLHNHPNIDTTTKAKATTNNNNVIHDMIYKILNQLDLYRVANTIVGDAAKIRGISGGERKRLSIAVQMISYEPSILLLDEPTSGLDYSSAYQLISLLRQMTNNNNNNDNSNNSIMTNKNNNKKKTTIIAVLHQPNQSILNMFDDILLIGHGGQQMYYGPRNSIRQYFEKDGQCYASSNEIGTAEHCLNCISYYPMNDNEMNNTKLIGERMKRLIHISNTMNKPNINQIIYPNNNNDTTIIIRKERQYLSSNDGPNISFIHQFIILLHRSFNEMKRSKLSIILNIVRLLSMAFIYGSIYQLKLNQSSIHDRIGLLSLIVIGATNIGMSKTIRTFSREKIIISSELSQHMYHTFPYFIAKGISELPFTILFNTIFGIVVYYMTGLDTNSNDNYNKIYNFIMLLNLHGITAESVGLLIGAISPNSDIALSMYPAIAVLNIIFDGKNISTENTPRLLRWIPKIGLIKWAFEGLCMNEFNGLIFTNNDDNDLGNSSNNNKFSRRQQEQQTIPMIQTGADALEQYGFQSERTLLDVVKAQITIALVCWILSYLALAMRKQKFVIMNKIELINE